MITPYSKYFYAAGVGRSSVIYYLFLKPIDGLSHVQTWKLQTKLGHFTWIGTKIIIILTSLFPRPIKRTKNRQIEATSLEINDEQFNICLG